MRYQFLPLDRLYESLPPEIRRDVDFARFRLALEGATDDEVYAALLTLGYLVQLLTGKRPFDRFELRSYVNITETEDDRE
mgnify:CR=1 FL=1